MRPFNRLLGLGSVVIVSLATIVPARANWSLVDNFDYLSPGTIQDGEGDWDFLQSGGTNTADFRIDVDPEDASNQVLSLSGEFDRTLAKVFPGGGSIGGTGSGTLYFRFRMKDFAVGNGPSVGVGLSDTTSSGGPTQTGPWVIPQGVEGGGSVGNSAGQNVVTGYAGTATTISSTIATDTWYSMWLVADHDTNQYQAYIQGGVAYPTQTLLTSESPLKFREDGIEALTKVFLRPNSANNQVPVDTEFFDDIFIDITGANLTVPVAPAFLQGDFDGMGGITLDDFQTLATNLFETRESLALDTATQTYAAGDFNFDLTVDLDDFFLFQAAYSMANPSAAALTLADLYQAAAVPEPSSVALLGVAALGLAAGVRRRCKRRCAGARRVPNSARTSLVLSGMVALGIGAAGAQTSHAVLLAYDGFVYSNIGDATAVGRNGGSGWTAAWGDWSEIAATSNGMHTVTQDDISLSIPGYANAPVFGDRIHLHGVLPTSGVDALYRTFPAVSMAEEGNTLYASFYLSKETVAAAGSENLEFNFMDSESYSSLSFRAGLGSTERFFTGGVTDTTTTAAAGENYFVVFKVLTHSDTPDERFMAYFGPDDTVPLGEPTEWDLTHTSGSSLVVDTARLWIGGNASGYVDELRIGTTWDDVVPRLPGGLLGDLNSAGGVNISDFQILADNLFETQQSLSIPTLPAMYAFGDINLDSVVNLDDFFLFREAYAAANPGAAALTLADLYQAATQVPEPASFAVLALALAGGGLCRWRRSQIAI